MLNFKLKLMNNNELAISSFNRKNCKTGIVHLGIGNFHRAHQANYINEYLNTSNNLNWGICGINLIKVFKYLYIILTNA